MYQLSISYALNAYFISTWDHNITVQGPLNVRAKVPVWAESVYYISHAIHRHIKLTMPTDLLPMVIVNLNQCELLYSAWLPFDL